MNTFDIINYVMPYQRNGIFKGVFACDTLPKKMKLPALYVVNLSPISEAGSHWIGIYIDTRRNSYYFDSFGMPPKNRFILAFLRKNAKKVHYNHKQLQHITSSKCGQYCSVLSVSILRFQTIEYFLRKFSGNLFINEIVIDRMYRGLRRRQ